MKHKLKAFLKKWRLKLGKVIFDRPKRKNAVFPTSMKRILINRCDGKVGDFIISSFIYERLKSAIPNAKIAVLCNVETTFLYERCPFIDEVFVLKKYSFKALWDMGVKLRKTGVDCLIDLNFVLRNRDLNFIRTTQAAWVIGVNKSKYRVFNQSIQVQNCHLKTIFEQVLGVLGANNLNCQYQIPQDEAAQRSVERFLSLKNIEDFAVLNLFGAARTRCVNVKNAFVLLQKVLQVYAKVVLIFAPYQKAQALKIWKNLSPTIQNRTFFLKEGHLFEAVALIKICDLVVTPDTSIVHIAQGLQKPMVTFYSQDEENFRRFGPFDASWTQVHRYTDDINNFDFEHLDFARDLKK